MSPGSIERRYRGKPRGRSAQRDRPAVDAGGKRFWNLPETGEGRVWRRDFTGRELSSVSLSGTTSFGGPSAIFLIFWKKVSKAAVDSRLERRPSFEKQTANLCPGSLQIVETGRRENGWFVMIDDQGPLEGVRYSGRSGWTTDDRRCRL